jgi:hypothetical protein
VGHGWNFSGGRQFAGYGDNYWFRNISGNVFGAFVNTSYPTANMGTFATDHDLLMGGGIGWWTGVYNAKFTMPSVTANRSYTLPDATGIVVVAAGTPSDGYSPVWSTASGTYIPSPPVAVGTTTKIYGPTTGSPSYIQPSWTAPSTGMYTFNYTAYVSTAGTAGTFMAQMECTSGISASGSSNNANGMANTSTVILSCYYTTGGKPYINLDTSGLTGSPVFTNVLWVTPMP